jgi:hypothetical protein
MKSRHLKQSHRRKWAYASHESDPRPAPETVSFSLPGFPSAGHKLATRKTMLRRERTDRLAIERGEDEGMPGDAHRTGH